MERSENIVIPIGIGALGVITTRFEKFTMEAGIELHFEHVQKTALLGQQGFYDWYLVLKSPQINSWRAKLVGYTKNSPYK